MELISWGRREEASTKTPYHGQKKSAIFALCLVLLWVSLILPLIALGQGGSPIISLYEMRSKNVFLQQFDLSCGAAALATILKFQHGEQITERQVALGLIQRDSYLSNPDLIRQRLGFSLLDMKRFAERRGYLGIAEGQLQLQELRDRAPAIVPIQTYGYNHFVVFRGANEQQVLLADSAFGNRVMSITQFSRVWINYRDFGHVAFRVERRDGLIPPDQLQAGQF